MYDYYDFVCDAGEPSPPPADWPTPKRDGWYCLVRAAGAKPQLMRCDADLSCAAYAQDGQWLWPHRIVVPTAAVAAAIRTIVFAALQEDDGREVILDFQEYPRPTVTFVTAGLAEIYLEHGPRAGALRAENLGPSQWGADGMGAWHQAKHAALNQGLAAQDQLLATG